MSDARFVVCRSCQGIFHKLTDQYTEDRAAHGGMFEAMDVVKKNHWWSFHESEATGPGGLECPSCGSLYVDGYGRLACQVVGARKQAPGLTAKGADNHKPTGEGSASKPSKNKKKTTPIPDDKNEMILSMSAQGASPSDIAKVVGATQQAVTKRLLALKKGDKS